MLCDWRKEVHRSYGMPQSPWRLAGEFYGPRAGFDTFEKPNVLFPSKIEFWWWNVSLLSFRERSVSPENRIVEMKYFELLFLSFREHSIFPRTLNFGEEMLSLVLEKRTPVTKHLVFAISGTFWFTGKSSFGGKRILCYRKKPSGANLKIVDFYFLRLEPRQLTKTNEFNL